MEDLFIKQEHDRWFSDNGDQTRLLNYNLSKESTVFDCGGYLGQWSNDIFNLYGCKIHIFEPLKEYQDHITHRFKNNKNIVIHDYGVASNDRIAKLYKQSDGSSEFLVMNPENDYEEVQLKKLSNIVNSPIDLIKINIEGAEYEVLIDLLNSGKIKLISNLLVQFHSENDGIKNATEIRKNIHNSLSQTHKLSWNYEFCWESWEVL